MENVDPNPENYVCAGIIGTKVTQVGVLIRLEPNRSSQVSKWDQNQSLFKRMLASGGEKEGEGRGGGEVRSSMPAYLVFLLVAKKICSLPCMVQNCPLCLKLVTVEQAPKKFVFQSQEVVFQVVKMFTSTYCNCSKIFMCEQDCRLFHKIWVQT